ncbi:hypothetical protein M634_12765 [Vibrio parahaemolyticus O1:Kuk str. FDA_R31]|nr:hypothetical protein M634_12765 [Vibrio parahaemolyticus O1:Kuk str. FDA_R31]ODW68623.1 hypothetical protein BBL89_08120 [Vibrio parahaemolyticus]ODW70706.1 hypothetical protein BBL90_07780 [Vibrio parahaemolyticus]
MDLLLVLIQLWDCKQINQIRMYDINFYSLNLNVLVTKIFRRRRGAGTNCPKALSDLVGMQSANSLTVIDLSNHANAT